MYYIEISNRCKGQNGKTAPRARGGASPLARLGAALVREDQVVHILGPLRLFVSPDPVSVCHLDRSFCLFSGFAHTNQYMHGRMQMEPEFSCGDPGNGTSPVPAAPPE